MRQRPGATRRQHRGGKRERKFQDTPDNGRKGKKPRRVTVPRDFTDETYTDAT